MLVKSELASPITLAMSMAHAHDFPAGPKAQTGLGAVGAGLARAACIVLAVLLLLGCSLSSDEQESTTPAQPTQSLTAGDIAVSQLDTMLLSEELIEGFRAQLDALAVRARVSGSQEPGDAARLARRPSRQPVRHEDAHPSEPGSGLA